MKKPVVSIVGCGWVGLPLLKKLAATGNYELRGTARKPEVLDAITAAGATAFELDLPDYDIPDTFLKDVDFLIWTLPPRGRQLGEAAKDHYLRCLQQLTGWLKADEHKSPRLLYLSSTGIYGDQKGTVTEDSPKHATTNSSKALLAGEEWLRSSPIKPDVLYLSGLIGPGRHPGRFFGGRNRPIPQADAPVNLVHQQDVIAAIELVIAQPTPGTYNICAAAHPRKGDFYTAAANALGLETAGETSGGADSKIIASTRIRALGWQPEWDDLDLTYLKK